MEKVLHISLVLRNEETDTILGLKSMTSMPDNIILDVNGQLAHLPIELLEKALTEVKTFQTKVKDLL